MQIRPTPQIIWIVPKVGKQTVNLSRKHGWFDSNIQNKQNDDDHFGIWLNEVPCLDGARKAQRGLSGPSLAAESAGRTKAVLYVVSRLLLGGNRQSTYPHFRSSVTVAQRSPKPQDKVQFFRSGLI